MNVSVILVDVTYSIEMNQSFFVMYANTIGSFQMGRRTLVLIARKTNRNKQEMYKNGNNGPSDPYLKHQQDSQREFYGVILFALGVCLLAGGISLCCTYRYVIRPYLTHSLKRSRSDPELAGLKNAPDTEKSV